MGTRAMKLLLGPDSTMPPDSMQAGADEHSDFFAAPGAIGSGGVPTGTGNHGVRAIQSNAAPGWTGKLALPPDRTGSGSIACFPPGRVAPGVPADTAGR